MPDSMTPSEITSPHLHASEFAEQFRKQIQCGLNLVSQLRVKLTSGELIATAIMPGTISRVTISSEACRRLTFDFLNNRAKLGSIYYEDLEIFENSKSQPSRIDRCVDFLNAQKITLPNAVKKVLFPMAKKVIIGLQSREFDAAYKAVFQRGRGKPKGTKA